MRTPMLNIQKLELFKPERVVGASGGRQNKYGREPLLTFYGNVQPFGEREKPENFGLDIRYAYVIFCEPNPFFAETDRVFDGSRTFQIKLIQRWRQHFRLLVEEVRA